MRDPAQLTPKCSSEPQTHLFGPSLNELSAGDLSWLGARGGQVGRVRILSPGPRPGPGTQDCSAQPLNSLRVRSGRSRPLQPQSSGLRPPSDSQAQPAAACLEAPTGGEEACRGPEGCRPVPSTPVTHFPRPLPAECGHVVSLAPSPGSISSPAQVSCPLHLLPAFQLVPVCCGFCLKMPGMSSLFCLSPGLAFAKSPLPN